jgi:rhamnose transport system ATP-binding protein
MRTLMGVKPAREGTIRIGGRPVAIGSPRRAHKLGLAYVPEDRKAEGLVMGWSIFRNAALTLMTRLGPLAFIGAGFDEEAIRKGGRGLSIKSRDFSQPVRELSGGNQQKVVIARELATDPTVLLLDEPTRGVDVGAKEDIYAQLAELAKRGVGILVASSELPELLGICDRIYVMFNRRIAAELPIGEATEEAIAYWASGAHEMASQGAAA